MEKKTLFIIGAGAVLAGVLVYVLKKTADAVGDAAGQMFDAINPTNNDNVINKGFTNVYQSATGSDGTLGTDIYDLFHKQEPISNPQAPFINVPGTAGFDKYKTWTDADGHSISSGISKSEWYD